MVVQKKRWWLLLLLLVVIIINTNMFWQMIYPIPYREVIWEQAEKFQQDPRLISAIIMVESKYNKNSVSKRGALGLMQIMPNTAHWAAEINSITYQHVEELAQPELNIYLGSWYVSYLQGKYDGSLPLVLAGYNSGPTKVDEWLKEGLWDGTLISIDQIPYGETRHYLQRVLHFYERYQRIY